MAGGPGHEQVDHPFRLRRIMRRLRRERVREALSGLGCARVASEQRTERQCPEPDAALLEEPAARDEPRVRVSIKMVLAIHKTISVTWRSVDLNPHYATPVVSPRYSFVIVSSKLRSTRETAVQAASCAGLVPAGSSGGC